MSRITLTVDFATEDSPYEPGLRFIYEGETGFATDTFRLSDGQEAVLLTAQQADAQFSSVDAYFTRDGAIYRLCILLREAGQEAAATETLKTLLAYF